MTNPARIALLLSLLTVGCGYHVSGHGRALPAHIKTIAIPAFGNATTHYRLTELLPAAIAREFTARTRYRIVADPNAADAVLTGSVLKYRTEVTTFDSTLQRATGATVYVGLRIVLRERTTNAVLYSASQFESRERYELSTDSRDYLDESDAVLARLSQAVARTVVSGVLEKFRNTRR